MFGHGRMRFCLQWCAAQYDFVLGRGAFKTVYKVCGDAAQTHPLKSVLTRKPDTFHTQAFDEHLGGFALSTCHRCMLVGSLHLFHSFAQVSKQHGIK